MWLRMSERWLFAYLPDPVYFFREHEGPITLLLSFFGSVWILVDGRGVAS